MGRMVEAWEGDTCVGSQTALVRRVAGAKKWSMHARSHIVQIKMLRCPARSCNMEYNDTWFFFCCQTIQKRILWVFHEMVYAMMCMYPCRRRLDDEQSVIGVRSFVFGGQRP